MKSYKEMYADSKKGGAVRQLTPAYKEWKKAGDQVVGAFISKNLISSSVGEGSYNQYVFETDDGVVKFHMGHATDTEVGEQFVKGMIYAIEYLGQEKISGLRSVNKFNVEELGPSGAIPSEPPGE